MFTRTVWLLLLVLLVAASSSLVRGITMIQPRPSIERAGPSINPRATPSPTITIIRPVSGSVYKQTEMVPFNWSHIGNIGAQVKITVTTQGGATVFTGYAPTSSGPSGNIGWMPAPAATDQRYIVMIASATQPQISAQTTITVLKSP